MKSWTVVSLLSAMALIGCGGGHAGADAAGGSAGSGGAGGSVTTDAGVDHPCGAPAQTYAFTTERIRMLGADQRAAGITLRADGSPLFYYWGGSTGAHSIWVTGVPGTDDAGVSVSVGFQLPRQPAGGDVQGAPVVRATRGGEVRIAYRTSIPGNTNDIPPRYIEWSGDINQEPIDSAMTTNPVPTMITFDLDPQDRPGVIYSSGTDVFLARNSGTGWVSDKMLSVADTQELLSLQVVLTFDPTGAPVVFRSTGDVYVIAKGAQGWSASLLDPDPDPVYRMGGSLIAGRDGLGQIEMMFNGYVPAGAGQVGARRASVRRAVGAPGAWDVHASVPTGGTWSMFAPNAMALGSAGEVHLAYTSNPFTYAYYDGCTWSTQTVADNGSIVGMALDGSGRPHIAYEKALDTSTPTTYEFWYAHPAP